MTRVGVVGYPVAQSRSPQLFAHWFARYGIDAQYDTIPVAPEAADAFFADLPAEWTGVNVTVPHKATAARHVVSEGAGARLGVVNTLWRDGDIVRGTSSDGTGFLASLDAGAPGWRDVEGSCVVLGAGGATVAVADVLVAEGRDVILVNRTHERALDVARQTGARALPRADLADALRGAALFVNATSLGMVGKPPLEVDLSLLPGAAVVSDIVYNPLRTPLLAEAAERGHRTVDGLGMLLHQATVGFEKWFGIRPEVDAELRQVVAASL